MAIKMRLRALKDGTEVVARIEHPMEAGDRIDPQSRLAVPAHFIQKVAFFKNGKEIAVADLSASIARDPVLRIKVRARSGDRIRLAWSDNKGDAGTEEIVVPRRR
jgi:sulfur-oxidizing protein SoxZ